MTGDKAFVERVYPLVAPHVVKLEAETAKDPWGLWPASGPYDNERIDGHYTGHSFWILRGLKDAVEMANVVGKKDEALRFEKVYDSYEHNAYKVRNSKEGKIVDWSQPEHTGSITMKRSKCFRLYWP